MQADYMYFKTFSELPTLKLDLIYSLWKIEFPDLSQLGDFQNPESFNKTDNPKNHIFLLYK